MQGVRGNGDSSEVVSVSARGGSSSTDLVAHELERARLQPRTTGMDEGGHMRTNGMDEGGTHEQH